MGSWVDIKDNNNHNRVIRVPYQAFKDVFERKGFSLVNDKSLDVSPTFSVSKENSDKPVIDNITNEIDNKKTDFGNEIKEKNNTGGAINARKKNGNKTNRK